MKSQKGGGGNGNRDNFLINTETTKEPSYLT